MGKRALLTIIFIYALAIAILSVVSTFSEAQTTFSAQRGFEWLAAHCPNGNCRSDIQTTAFYTLAMKDAGQLEYANLGLEYIKSREDTTHCWPRGGCSVKDTAFALRAFDAYGLDTSQGEEYLRTALSVAPDLENFWYLEAVTTNNATCTLVYDTNNKTSEKVVQVDGGTFPECPSGTPTFFDLNACIQPNLLSNSPSLELNIDCSALGPSTILSILFVDSNNFYIIDEQQSSSMKTVIQNGCFGVRSRSSCDLETSLMTNWLLVELGSDTTSYLYARNSHDKFNAQHNAFLFLSAPTEGKTSFLDQLVSLQESDGSFDRNVFTTAVSILALKQSAKSQEFSKAAEWLKSKQQGDGSWNTNELDTAITLYSSFTGEPVSLPPIFAPIPGSESLDTCGDGLCSGTESALACPQDCQIAQTCNNDGFCQPYLGETEVTCPGDCEPIGTKPSEAQCGNGILEAGEQCDISSATGFGDDSSCPDACTSFCICESESEGKGGFPWLWTLFIIAIIGVGIFLFKRKRGSNDGKKNRSKQNQSPFSQMMNPSQPSQPTFPTFRAPPQTKEQRSSSIDDELEKSLKEAKKLLKKL